MLRGFKGKAPEGARADPEDTTAVTVRNYEKGAEALLMTPPDFKTVKPIESVVGKRPPLFNLRDHPDFDSRAFTIVQVREATGEFGFHCYLAGWLSEDQKPETNPQACIIRTGSEFVLGRVIPAIATIHSGQPLYGILRTAGRAWLFE